MLSRSTNVCTHPARFPPRSGTFGYGTTVQNCPIFPYQNIPYPSPHWSHDYVRILPPWTNDCIWPVSYLKKASEVPQSPDPQNQPPFSRSNEVSPPKLRPILRRFDANEPRPSNVGQPSPPQQTDEFIQRLKSNKRPRSRGKFCVVCRENGEQPEKYRSHNVKSSDGVVVCPSMRAYNCPECQNGGGDRAHSITHCPLRRARIFDQLVRLGKARREGRILDNTDSIALAIQSL